MLKTHRLAVIGNQMDLAPNPFTRALQVKQRQIRLWVSVTGNIAAEVVARARFDWAPIEMVLRNDAMEQNEEMIHGGFHRLRHQEHGLDSMAVEFLDEQNLMGVTAAQAIWGVDQNRAQQVGSVPGEAGPAWHAQRPRWRVDPA